MPDQADKDQWIKRVLGIDPGSAWESDALNKALTALVHRIPEVAGADTMLKANLAKLAGDANASIKSGKLPNAADLIAHLRELMNGSGAPKKLPVGRDGDVPGTMTETRREPMDGSGQAKPQPGEQADETPGPGADWQAARHAWLDANDAVDDQINGLRKALLARVEAGDPDVRAYSGALRRIAEVHLDEMTGNHRATVMDAVTELGDGTPATISKSGAKMLAAITAFQSFLAGSRRIAACDANPFGAPVAIRATLGPALQKMADALAGAAGA